MRISSLSLAMLIILGYCLPGMADENDNDRILQILSAWEAQQLRRQPVLIRYRLTEYHSAALQSSLLPKSYRARNSNREITRKYELALKGTRSYVKSDGPFGLTPEAARSEPPSAFIFDGAATYENFAGRYAVSSSRLDRGFMTPWTVTGEQSILRGWRKWREGGFQKEGKKIEHTVRDEKDSSGEALVRIDTSTEGSGSVTRGSAWLRPALDYAVVRSEVYNAKGQLLNRHDQCVYESHNGVFYPRSATFTVYSPGEGGREPSVLWRTELKVDSIETNPERIPDSLFHLDIPKDKPVLDLDTNTLIADPKAVQEHLDRLSADLPGRRIKRWWPAVATVSLLVLLLVGGGLWWRRRRRRMATP